MGIASEPLEEPAHLLVDHGVTGHEIIEIMLLGGGRKFAIKQEIAGLQKIPVLGKLLDRITAIEQYSLITIYIGDFGFAARSRREARIVRENIGLGVEPRDVDHIRPDSAFIHGKRVILVTKSQSAALGVSTVKCVHAAFLDEIALHCDSRSFPRRKGGGPISASYLRIFRLRTAFVCAPQDRPQLVKACRLVSVAGINFFYLSG